MQRRVQTLQTKLPGKVWFTLTSLTEWVYHKLVLQLLLFSGTETYQKKKRGNLSSSVNFRSQSVMLMVQASRKLLASTRNLFKIKVQLLKTQFSLAVYRVVSSTKPIVRKSWNRPISLHFSLRGKPKQTWQFLTDHLGQVMFTGFRKRSNL